MNSPHARVSKCLSGSAIHSPLRQQSKNYQSVAVQSKPVIMELMRVRDIRNLIEESVFPEIRNLGCVPDIFVIASRIDSDCV